jgi:hypothetical protein
MQHHTTLNLPFARAAQLKDLAKQKNVTVADIVDEMIRREWSALGQSHILPPFELIGGQDDDTAEAFVHFSGPALPIIEMSPEEALQVAHAIENVATNRVPREAIKISARETCLFVIERKGRGYIFSIAHPVSSPGKAVRAMGLTQSVAADLATAFHSAVIQAGSQPSSASSG